MTNKEILANTKVGDIVRDGRILSALKRKGLIADFSSWGYLENHQVKYKDTWDGKVSTEWDYIEVFPNATAKECEFAVFNSRSEMMEKVGYGNITYMGCEFRTKYLDGCFNPYLQLVSKDGMTEQEVHPRMSVNGAIV